MVPEDLKRKVEAFLKNESFSEADGDKIAISSKGDGIFYAYVKSEKRGSFGQMVISNKDLSFLFAGSAINPEVLLARYKAGVRSMPHQSKPTRRNVKLPVIEDDTKIVEFAKQMTDTFINLFDEQDIDKQDLLNGKWYDMIYNALVLLLSAKEKETKLILLTMVYHSPAFVKTFLQNVKEQNVYNYWIKEVPQIMKADDAQMKIHYFDVRIASLIGEQEIQDLCNKYKC